MHFNSNNVVKNEYIMRTLIFPGQGSQSVGMASEFYNNFNSVKKFFL